MKKVLATFLVVIMCATFSCVVIADGATKKFSDVDTSTAIGQAIEVLANAGVLSGDGDGKFRPDDSLSRAELCKVVNMIFKYTEKDTTGFSDVSKDAWYYEQVLIAKKAGYIKGYEDGTFRADNKVSREQACVILARITGIKDNGKKVEIADKVAEWALPSVKLVIAHEFMALEKGNTFRATQNITRGEFSHTHARFVKSSPSTNQGVVVGGGGGTGGGGGGGGAIGGGGGGSSSSTPTINYQQINAEMVSKLNRIIGALDQKYANFQADEKQNVIDPIKACLQDAVNMAQSYIIDKEFIINKYATQIASVKSYRSSMNDEQWSAFMTNMSEVNTASQGALMELKELFGLQMPT